MEENGQKSFYFFFIKHCYDVRNYESNSGATKHLFKEKQIQSLVFSSLSLSLSTSLSYGKFLEKRSRTPGLLIKSTQSLNP